MGEPQKNNHRIRKAAKETLVVNDQQNFPEINLSIYCRTPEQLANVLEYVESKNPDIFPQMYGVADRLRKLSELQPGNSIDLKAIQAEPEKHVEFLKILEPLQTRSSVWIIDLPERRGKTSHIRKNRDLADCPEQNVSLFGFTLNTDNTRKYGRELVGLLEEKGLPGRNKITVNQGEDMQAKCRDALMNMECTKRW